MRDFRRNVGLQHHLGWERVNLGVLPLIAATLLALWWPIRWRRRRAVG